MDIYSMNVYRIYFTIQIDCKGIISYTEAHISVRANSAEEAAKILKENFKFTYNKTNKIEKLLD